MLKQLLVALLAGTWITLSAPAATSPNIVSILADDLGYPLIDKTQLFDLQAEPHEMNDLAANPQYADRIKQLTALLEKPRKEFGDKAPLVVPNPKPAAWSPGKAGGGKTGGQNGQKTEEE